MPLSFAKMHGLGNDFVLIAQGAQAIAAPERLAQALCDRRHGVGADGLLVLGPVAADSTVLRVTIFNADGSRAETCGNGVRCAAKYAYEHKLIRKNPLALTTDAGMVSAELVVDSADRVAAVRVNMGVPRLDPRHIPVRMVGEHVISKLLEVAGKQFAITCVSMGNPHTVIFRQDLDDVPLGQWGPAIERHALFPEGTNVHFARVVDRARVQMISWERGAGATVACGSGACAVTVAGVLNHLLDRNVTVHLPGGRLQIEWSEALHEIQMTGPAVEVFTGVWPER